MFIILQIIISIILIVIILLQQQEGGLGSAFGQTSFRTRQGVEKMLLKITVLLILIFLGLSIWAVVK